jgi:hypothetical protein
MPCFAESDERRRGALDVQRVHRVCGMQARAACRRLQHAGVRALPSHQSTCMRRCQRTVRAGSGAASQAGIDSA